MNDSSSRDARRLGLFLMLGTTASGCINLLDEGGETKGQPRRGEEVDAESSGGAPEGPGIPGSGGGPSPGGSGGSVGGDGSSTGGADGGTGPVGTEAGGSGAGGTGAGGLISDGGSPGDGGAGDGGSGVASGGANAGSDDWAQAALDKHNEVRALHCVPEMMWDEAAADFAQAWAEGLCPTMNLTHSMGSGYGENLYMSWGTGAGTDLVASAIGAVTGWYNEIEDYDFSDPGFASGTGHFTQVVWEGSTAVGCGIATCTVSQWNVVVVSCNYSPPGNYSNQFEENVPPLCQ